MVKDVSFKESILSAVKASWLILRSGAVEYQQVNPFTRKS